MKPVPTDARKSRIKQASDAVTQLIDQDELISLVLELSNIDSPPGQEQPVSDYVFSWLERNEIEARQVGMFPDRQNVVGRLRGDGSGDSIIFNAHMDTAWGPEERRWMHHPDDPVFTSGWREGDRLYGNGVVNDKGPLACTLIALKSLRDANIPLAGDVFVTGVCGEIGMEPVDEFSAPIYLSKEVGTRYLIEHGVIGDYALVAENSSFGITTVEAGKAFFKLTVLGGQTRYTPYVDHSGTTADNENAIVRAAALVPRIIDWARHYEHVHTYPFTYGSCIPKVNIGAVRGGQPFIPITSPEQCYLYLDVRLTPSQTAMDVQRELLGVLADIGVPVDLECTLYRRGYEAEGAEPLIASLTDAHLEEFGEAPGGVSPGQASSWRDTNPFNELGIPSLSYGPSAGMGGRRAWTTVADLERATRVYARTAVRLSGR
ncbi:MAG: M20/M25/M40 family metallo-hydrolase [Dehalococcoidia bacterium]